MNSGLEKPKAIVRQLEIFPCLEDIPDYQSKLEAWEYAQKYYALPENERGSLIGPTKAHYGTTNPGGARGVCRVINNKFKFPITHPSDDNDFVNYKDIRQIEHYFKDILDKNGELLHSREVKKAA